MENASKALLIAGGVLVTLSVVSIIMLIFNKAGDFNKDQTNNLDKKKIAYHNSQFTIYERELQKNEVEKLIDVVLKTNKNAETPEYQVSIRYIDSHENTKFTYNKAANKLVGPSNMDIKDKQLDSLDIFTCTTVTNSNGIINEIHITKK